VPGPTREHIVSRRVLASFTNYDDAQRAVDQLSDGHFPVEHITIVGTGLKSVETVLGRLSWGRAALSGLAMGAWFGVLIGLFVSLFANGDGRVLTLVLLGLLYGAAFGIVFGLVSYAFTGGKRDFVSRSQLVADEYQVTVDPEQLAEAQRLLNPTSGQPTSSPGGNTTNVPSSDSAQPSDPS
jgi:hypothetical protein